MTQGAADALLALVELLPHGVDKMSHVMADLVETSCNLASVKQTGTGEYQVRTACLSESPMHARPAGCRDLARRAVATIVLRDELISVSARALSAMRLRALRINCPGHGQP